MEQINFLIKTFNLDYLDRFPSPKMLEMKHLRNSECMLAVLILLFFFNAFGILRWISLGVFAFVIPAWLTLTEYKLVRTTNYAPLLCYWMLIAGLLRIEQQLSSIPLFYTFEYVLVVLLYHPNFQWARIVVDNLLLLPALYAELIRWWQSQKFKR